MTASDEEFAQRAYPGCDLPVVAFQQSHRDWTRYGGRGDEGTAQWTPLGPTFTKVLPNPYRDRSVYTAGTANSSGRDAFLAIDPNCGSKGHGEQVTARAPRTTAGGTTATTTATTNRPAASGSPNANGGICAHRQRALEEPASGSTSRACSSTTTPRRFQLDPNDKQRRAAAYGTGEAERLRAPATRRASGLLPLDRPAVTGWSGPARTGQDAFYDRAVGSGSRSTGG